MAIIMGTSWSDSLVGGSGNDTIDGNGGSDRIDGGEGADTVLFFADSSKFTVTTLQGVTHVKEAVESTFPYVVCFDTVVATEKAQVADSLMPPSTYIYYNESVMTNVETIQFADATLSLAATAGPVIFGSSWTDQLVGTAADDTIDGMGGGDRIDGGAGTDTALFFNDIGNFSVITLSGITHVRDLASSGNYYYYYGNADTVLVNVESLQFADTSIALPGASSQAIFGNYWTDQINGTAGDDIIDGLGGSDRIDGGSGSDTALFFDSSSNFSVMTLSGVTHVRGLTTSSSSYSYSDSILLNVENIQFSDASVSLSASDVNGKLILGSNYWTDQITGTAGDDIIDGLGGSDQINGGRGTDTVLFFDDSANFSVLTLAGVTHVKALSGASSAYAYTDTILVNVENIQFADKTLKIGDGGESGEQTGTPDDDVLFGGYGQRIDGGDGKDILVYDGNLMPVTVGVGGIFNVGLDTVANIERLEFDDKKVALDMGANQAGGQTALMIGACIGTAGLSDKVMTGQVLSYFDAGNDLSNAADFLVSSGITEQLAGGADNTDFIAWLAGNFADAAPSSELLAACVSMLDQGTFTQAGFLGTLAATDFNQQHINLVGLQQTGMEYL